MVIVYVFNEFFPHSMCKGGISDKERGMGKNEHHVMELWRSCGNSVCSFVYYSCWMRLQFAIMTFRYIMNYLFIYHVHLFYERKKY